MEREDKKVKDKGEEKSNVHLDLLNLPPLSPPLPFFPPLSFCVHILNAYEEEVVEVGDSWLPRQQVDEHALPRQQGHEGFSGDGGTGAARQIGTRIILRAFRFDAFSGLSVADLPPGMEEREVCRLHEYEILVPRGRNKGGRSGGGGGSKVTGGRRESGLGHRLHLAGRQEGKERWNMGNTQSSDMPTAMLVHERCLEEVSG